MNGPGDYFLEAAAPGEIGVDFIDSTPLRIGEQAELQVQWLQEVANRVYMHMYDGKVSCTCKARSSQSSV